jgi:hypothetical protein
MMLVDYLYCLCVGDPSGSYGSACRRGIDVDK